MESLLALWPTFLSPLQKYHNIIPMFDVGNISLLVTALLLGMTKDCSCYCVATHYLTTSLLAVSEVVLGMLATRY